jgi:Ala-tRNA(Pro) deacylase
MHIEQYLTNQGVWFEMIQHRPAFTAQAAARAMHASPTEVAKGVLIKADEYVLAVVPACTHVDLVAVRKVLGADDVFLVHESELLKHFPDCESGAVPPFGSRYGMVTVLDESLAKEPEITFCGNRHCEAIRMRCQDFLEIERPTIAMVARVPEPVETAR